MLFGMSLVRTDHNYQKVTDTPLIARQLTPHLHYHKERLHVRRVLTRYLLVQIISSDSPAECYHSVLPYSNVSAVRYLLGPSSGLHFAYLRALETNVIAREENNLALRRIVNVTHNNYSRSSQCHMQSFRDHLLLLHKRRIFQAARILHHYLNILNESYAAQPKYVSVQDVRFPRNEFNQSDDYSRSSTNSRIRFMVHCLERTLLQIEKHDYFQNTQLECLRSRCDEQFLHFKLEALCQTLGELANWVEESLAKQVVENEHFALESDVFTPSKQEESCIGLKNSSLLIKEQYQVYLVSRRRIICESMVHSPLFLNNSHVSIAYSEARAKPLHLMISSDILRSLSCTMNTVLILSKPLNIPLIQRSFFRNILEEEISITLKSLVCLREESHLLHYCHVDTLDQDSLHAKPMQALREPILNITNYTRASSLVPHSYTWFSASIRAYAASGDSILVEAKVAAEIVKRAERILQEMYDTLQ